MIRRLFMLLTVTALSFAAAAMERRVPQPLAGPATHFGVSVIGPVWEGRDWRVTVTALDAANSIVTGYTNQIAIETVPFTNWTAITQQWSQGQTTDYLPRIDTAGNYTLKVVDRSNGGVQGSTPFVVQPLAAGVPVGMTVGLRFFEPVAEPIVFRVWVVDKNKQPAPSYRGTVHFSTNSAHADLPPDYTFTAADAGIHDFTLTIWSQASFQSFTLEDVNDHTLQGYGAVDGTFCRYEVQAAVSGGGCGVPTAQLTATTAHPSTGGLFSWTGPGGFHSNQQNPVVTMPGTYTVTATLPFVSCITTKPVTVAAVGGGPAAIVPSRIAVCPGLQATLPVSLSGKAPWTIEWSDGMVQRDVRTDRVTRPVDGGATGTLTITKLTDASCSITDAAPPVQIDVNSAPAIATQPRDVNDLAAGATATFMVAAQGNDLHYLWSIQGADGIVKPAGTDSASFTTPPLRGNATVWVTISNACRGVESRHALANLATAKRRATRR